eukprot:CAMPEP_0202879252 /NCGR_PEP_ID=MMETSP1391-20130828/33357_1 /ASSEMBLY_ACC=CAM_ASM_000867 /TAXON_ID=1034604 /ORGANISM="Chlamydomonas leiostraca, Strain SAG 11-49" /LENGTH=92 /DNA_ID=CAMNT_0049561569 /DNA_START=328 /DNA_END=607 /DNA_ORIENTATION=-
MHDKADKGHLEGGVEREAQQRDAAVQAEAQRGTTQPHMTMFRMDVAYSMRVGVSLGMGSVPDCAAPNMSVHDMPASRMNSGEAKHAVSAMVG